MNPIKIRMPLVFCAVFFIVTGVSAAEPYTNSIGNFSCETWLSDKNTNMKYSDEGWVEGFITSNELSASGRLHENLTIDTDTQSIFSWIDNFCRTNQTSTLSDATNAFLDFHPYRQITY